MVEFVSMNDKIDWRELEMVRYGCRIAAHLPRKSIRHPLAVALSGIRVRLPDNLTSIFRQKGTNYSVV